MARLCTVCFHSDSAQINVSLASGIAVATISSQTTISESALRRHTANHLGNLLVRDGVMSDTTTTPDLIDRLQHALDDVDRVRASALATGRGELVLKAAAQTRALIDTMMARLGIDVIESAQLLREAKDIARAIGVATRLEPGIGHAVARELGAISTDQTNADALKAMATSVEQQRVIRE